MAAASGERMRHDCDNDDDLNDLCYTFATRLGVRLILDSLSE